MQTNRGQNRLEKTRDLFKKIRDTKGTFHASSVQLLTCVRLFVTPVNNCMPDIPIHSITNSWSLPKPMFIELVMPSNHLILCRPLLFLPSIFPSIRVFSNESALRISWPKYWSFSFIIGPSNEYSGTGKEFSRVTELFYIPINNV